MATDATESALLLRTVLQYDEVNRLQGYEDTLFGTHSFETEYTYGDPAEGEDPNTVYSVSRNGSQLVGYAYDSLGRRTSRTLSAGNRTTTYTYEDVDSEHTTFRLSQLKNSAYGWYSYTYDELGYIIRIDELNSGEYASYTYDALGQLIRENSSFENKTYVWTYDGSGNILSKKTYAFTTGALGTVLDTDTYTYGDSNWKDKLTSYNGTEITYDEIGNPISYRDGMSFVWQAGRQLKSITQNGVVSTYTYNEDGIRTSKTVNGVTTEFIISGGQLIAAVNGNQWLYFIYNESGTIIGFTAYSSGYTYNYYYEFNAQGDVVALLDYSGYVVATYKYDAWGKLLGVYDYTGNLVTSSGHIGIINPIRYRGYFYDEETGLYYLQSRYYDPEIGRFINADSYASTGQGLLGTNMYAYCMNNPVLYMDLYGSECTETPLTNWTGYLTSVDYAAMDIYMKVDVNHDGFFTEKDIYIILTYYNCKEKKDTIRDMIRDMGGLSNGPITKTKKNYISRPVPVNKDDLRKSEKFAADVINYFEGVQERCREKSFGDYVKDVSDNTSISIVASIGLTVVTGGTVTFLVVAEAVTAALLAEVVYIYFGD